MKFQIGDVIIRGRRKHPRTVLDHRNGGYTLSDNFNGFGSEYIVESQFKKLDNHEQITYNQDNSSKG